MNIETSMRGMFEKDEWKCEEGGCMRSESMDRCLVCVCVEVWGLM